MENTPNTHECHCIGCKGQSFAHSHPRWIRYIGIILFTIIVFSLGVCSGKSHSRHDFYEKSRGMHGMMPGNNWQSGGYGHDMMYYRGEFPTQFMPKPFSISMPSTTLTQPDQPVTGEQPEPILDKPETTPEQK